MGRAYWIAGADFEDLRNPVFDGCCLDCGLGRVGFDEHCVARLKLGSIDCSILAYSSCRSTRVPTGEFAIPQGALPLRHRRHLEVGCAEAGLEDIVLQDVRIGDWLGPGLFGRAEGTRGLALLARRCPLEREAGELDIGPVKPLALRALGRTRFLDLFGCVGCLWAIGGTFALALSWHCGGDVETAGWTSMRVSGARDLGACATRNRTMSRKHCTARLWPKTRARAAGAFRGKA
jgi:hypothetical protein